MTTASETATTGRSTGAGAGQHAAERSRDRILAAAAELARERGVAGATIARVCQRSGLPVSSVYWHFEDKDHLFAEVIRTSFASWLVSVPRWDLEDGSTLEDGLRRILGASAHTLVDVPAFLRVGMQVVLETSEQNVKTRQAFHDVREQVQRMITAWLLAFLDHTITADLADDLADLIVATSDGMLVGSQLYASWDPDEYVRLVVGTVTAAVESARGA